MQETITSLLTELSGIIWGLPLILLLLGTGIYLTIILRGLQFRTLIPSLYLAFVKRHEEGEGDISHFQALMAFPNLVGLLGLSKVVVDETKKYLDLEISHAR